jgi:hypothetical protein
MTGNAREEEVSQLMVNWSFRTTWLIGDLSISCCVPPANTTVLDLQSEPAIPHSCQVHAHILQNVSV